MAHIAPSMGRRLKQSITSNGTSVSFWTAARQGATAPSPAMFRETLVYVTLHGMIIETLASKGTNRLFSSAQPPTG